MTVPGIVVPFDEQQTAIEAAFRRLRVQRTTRGGIPYEILIPGIARELMTMGRADSPRRWPANQRELAKIHKLSAGLLEALEASDLAALSMKPKALRALKTHLRILRADVKIALGQPPQTAREARSRPPKVVAATITKRVAEHYYWLTGRRPTVTNPTPASPSNRRGEFVDLLQTVFDVLGVKASAPAQARAFARAFNRRNRRA